MIFFERSPLAIAVADVLPAIRERGYEPLELAREHYVGHPNNTPDPADYETRMVWPVKF